MLPTSISLIKVFLSPQIACTLVPATQIIFTFLLEWLCG